MTANRISIILEVLSFFLVTLDLFGRERLAKFYRAIIRRIRTTEIRLHKFIEEEIQQIIVAGMVVIMGLSYILIFRYLPIFVGHFPKTMPFLVGCLIAIVVIALCMAALIFAIFYLLVGIMLFSFFVLRNLGKFFALYRLEGVMLAIGTVLFLISKVIEFMN